MMKLCPENRRCRKFMISITVAILCLLQFYKFLNGDIFKTSCDFSEEKNNKIRHVLKTVTEVLEKHNVTYWLDNGALLGAYRLILVLF